MKFKIDWQALKKVVFEQLKGAGVKLALKKLLGTAAMGGVKAWVIKFIAEDLIDEIGIPVANWILQKSGQIVYKFEGKIFVKRIDDARENNDSEAYDDVIDDVLGGRAK